MRSSPFIAVCAWMMLSAHAGCSRTSDVATKAPPTQPTEERLRIELVPSTPLVAAHFLVLGLDEPDRQRLEELPPDKLGELLQVFVLGGLDRPPPIAGRVSLDAAGLRFEPRYPLEPAIRYRAEFRRELLSQSSPAAESLTREFELPALRVAPAHIVGVYPSADRLPENQLKFYVYFSAPMSRGQSYRHIHLLDPQGRELEGVFLELGEELWDDEQRRFTLFCDPGRVKQGLKPREELGPVLEQGQHYTLVIDRDWCDSHGTPLRSGITKRFEVVAADTARIDPAQWQIESPPAGTRSPCVVRFPESLDRALLERMIWVADAEGKKLAGEVEIGKLESIWTFTPRDPWPAGGYQLVVDSALEDLAGNSIGRAFEVDLAHAPDQPPTPKRVEIPFTVQPETASTP